MNDHFVYEFNAWGGEVHLYHTTIGKNTAGGYNSLYSEADRSIWLSNSIIDSECDKVLYTHGRSVISGICVTVPDPQTDLGASVDISNTNPLLQPLANGSANVPNYKVMPIESNSPAVNIGRDDQWGCNEAHVLRHDQNQASRPVGACDAGAIEVGEQPPFFTSNPLPGLIQFPIVDNTLGQTESTVSLSISNAGGGAMTYELMDMGGSAFATSQTPAASRTGTLFKNQPFTFGFKCTPPLGEYWHVFDIVTNAPNKKRASYKLRCTAVGSQQLASMSEQPGAFNMPTGAPGQTSSATIYATNRGHMPLTTNYGWTDSSAMWTSTGTKVMGPSAQKLQPQGASALTLNPGETLKLDLSCTPPAAAVYVNTFVLTTDDPLAPKINYDSACEGAVAWPPEALQPGVFTSTPSHIAGIAISPEGNQVLAGDYDDQLVRVFSRNATTGALSASALIGSAGMTQIYGIQFSHDGQNVYYTSQAGDGVVNFSRNGTSLSFAQVLTTGTRYLCGYIQFCSIGSMNGARGVAVSPDDKFVYVSGYTDGSLTVFNRNLSSGLLSFAQAITRTIAGVNVLGGAARISVSPDGAHVYVTAAADDTLAVFKRTSSGRLSLVASYKDGVGGMNYLNGPQDVTVSPDANFVYVTSNADSAINVFTRSTGDGQLSLSSVITGVISAYGIATTHDNDGKRVFVAQYAGDKVMDFGRNADTGALSLVGTYNYISPTSNINGPVFFAVSPDNLHVYASLFDGQGVRLFETVHSTPVLGQISPAAAVAGTSAFTLTVKGGRFYRDSKIVWGATPLTTIFVNDHELKAQIPSGFIMPTGNFVIKVRNATPGGGDSAAATFAVVPAGTPLVPSIESVEPPEASFGGGDLSVLIHGANFAANAQVTYNGKAVPTTFINSQTLQVLLSAAILQAPGTGGLAVSNGGAALAAFSASAVASNNSSVVGFSISAADKNALPSVTAVAPSSVVSGSAAIWVTLSGHNFSTDPQAQSVGRWNGQARSTVIVNAAELKMLVSSDDLRTASDALISVLTPNVGESEPLAFKVRLPSEKPVPVLTSVVVAGTTLYVNGSDFDAGAQVRINGVPRAATFVNGSQLKVTLTTADSGGVLTVTNPTPGGGTSNELPFVVRFIMLPLIRR